MQPDTYSDSIDPSLSIGEAARALGVSISTVRNWEVAGKLSAFRTPGNQRRFRLSDIDAIRNGAVA